MAIQDQLTVELVEKEIVNIDLVEKEIINCELKVTEILSFREKRIVSGLIHEVPTKILANKFSTSVEFVTGSLSVYLNGLKVKIADITEIDNQTFTIVDSTILSDLIEVTYLELGG